MSKSWRVLLGVWAAALLLRLAYLWQIAHLPFFDLRIGDAEAYHAWGRRIADGDWLGRDVFYQAPLYPYVLASIYRVLGDSATIVRIVQAAIGATSCALLASAGMSLFGTRGAIAGVMLAVYPAAIYFDGLLEKSALVTCLTAALLALMSMPASSSRVPMRRWLAIGAVLGLLSLTRENALLLALPVLLWIAWGDGVSESRASRWRVALAFVIGCWLILVPVALRNRIVGGEFHLTTSQLGPNFYIGNHAGASGTYEPLVVGHGSAADERDDATRLAEEGMGTARGTARPAEVSRYWTMRGLADIRAHPTEWLALMARKLGMTFSATEIADTESQAVYAEGSWLLRLLSPFDFGLLLAAAAFGVVLTARAWRRLWFLYAIGATYAISVVVFYVFARYRFPIVPVLMLLATAGIVDAIEVWRRRRPIVVGAAAAVIAIGIAHLPLHEERGARATHYDGIAGLFAKDPARTDEAMRYYRRALEDEPDDPAAQFGLGTLLVRLGRAEEAVPYFDAAIRVWPEHAEARYNLGLALAAIGRADEASQQYTEALRLRPDDADAHAAFAKTLIALRKPDLAVLHYEASLTLRPRNPTALVGLGVALTQIGRAVEAIQKYEAALAIDPRDASAHNSFGWTLATEGRLAEAVPHFERALEINPADENAKRNLEQVRQLEQRK